MPRRVDHIGFEPAGKDRVAMGEETVDFCHGWRSKRSAEAVELHLHAFAAANAVTIKGHPVTVRPGRQSGLRVAAIGQMLGASAYFQDVTQAEMAAVINRLAGRQGWGTEEIALVQAAAAEAFPS